MYKNLLKAELEKIIEKLGAEKVRFNVEKPAEEKYGDYATNLAMVLTKTLKKPPLEIAKDVLGKLKSLDFIERIELEPPGFINFYLKKDNFLANLGKILAEGEKYGSKTADRKTKIVLEHTAVNPNKALHVGHLRSACLGSACEKILEFLGSDVEVEYYVDDTGVQVAVSVLGALELDIEPSPREKFDHFAGRAYVEAMSHLEKNKKLEKRRDQLIGVLDRQEGPELKFIREFVENVIEANLATTQKFNIDYDVLICESDILLNHFWTQAFEILKQNPNFYLAEKGKNKGCWVMKGLADPATEAGAGNEKVIVKSNGVVTYTGKDIAYHLWKFNLLGADFKYKKWPTKTQSKPLYSTSQQGKKSGQFGRADSVVNFIDLRQAFPQQIVKKSLEALGYAKEAGRLKHVGYGVVSLAPKTARELGMELKEGKQQYAMSGRSGLVVLADDLLDLIVTKLKQKHRGVPQPEKIAAAAIKYLLLSHNPLSDIVFSYDRALDIYGNSGPYLQYTYARGRSVLRKAATLKKKAEFSKDFTELNLSTEESGLLQWLVYFSETVQEAGKQLAPNLLCNYLYELSSRFNTFYNKRPILKSKKGPQSVQFRLALTAAAIQLLGNGLDLLGIEKLEKM